MKILFASDIHGSAEAAELLAERTASLKPDAVALLGDYLGRRDSRITGVPPILNPLSNIISAVRGNCDTEETQFLFDFRMLDSTCTLHHGNLRIFLSHGDRWNPGNPPPLGAGDIIAFGHTHIPFLKTEPDGTLFLNPGSAGLPRGGYPPSFAFYDDGFMQVLSLENMNVLLSASILK